ncbi:FeoC like transcriptional regulator [Cohaesibacter sp. ES.047]|uniref:FeoC-like transcriptional regulator n=1 Tax=Cohaesibacter sp. ES.047 TaxID=1798205 RepID=UPI000BB91BDA|nr:FeoC-like transcriptional regulator [Cohaesibacter sp. ES.047]SNY90335.1 FeoC like transcriptional regulator [Cohaesibacter sp. ES.047]
MILSDVNRYVAERGEVTAIDIALHFGVAPDALKGILDMLAAKGRIRPIAPDAVPTCGKTCCSCAVSGCEPERWESVKRA